MLRAERVGHKRNRGAIEIPIARSCGSCSMLAGNSIELPDDFATSREVADSRRVKGGAKDVHARAKEKRHGIHFHHSTERGGRRSAGDV